MNKILSNITQAVRTVFGNSRYIILSVVIFMLFFAMYSFVLPATYTGGKIGIVSLKLITPKLAIFAFLFSFLLAFVLPFAMYAFREKKKGQKTSSATGSFLGSVLPPLFCCSPILPTIAAAVVGIFPFAFGVSGFVQGFMATYETQIFTLVVFILMYSMYQNAKQVINTSQGICMR